MEAVLSLFLRSMLVRSIISNYLTLQLMLKCLLLSLNWYAKMFVVIRWNNSLSRVFAMESGVRQSSTLSPSIFNVFMNTFIVSLILLDVDCHVNHQFVDCFFVCR